MPVKTPKEFKEKMQELDLTADGDCEIFHGKADELMCEMLIDLGYGEGVQIFTSADKWYA